MVSFELKEDNVSVAVYWYYPEEDKENYGVLELNKEDGIIGIGKLAPNDFSREISVEELNSLRNSVSAMRKENDEPELTEEEWPSSTEPEVSTFYADHAIRKIADAYRNGVLLKNGKAIWY